MGKQTKNKSRTRSKEIIVKKNLQIFCKTS